MHRQALLVVVTGMALAIPGTASADVPVPPPNIHACNGVVVAAGDHPEGAPAFYAQFVGLPVDVAIAQARQDFECTHP